MNPFSNHKVANQYVDFGIIQIRSASATKVYDGTPLTAEVSGSASKNSEYFEKVCILHGSSRTAVGSIDNAVTIQWLINNFKYDQIELDIGTLTVTPQSIEPDDPDV